MKSTDRDASPRRAPRAARVVDGVVTVLLLAAMTAAAAVLLPFGALIGMQADVCAGEATCAFVVIDTAVQVVRFAPAVLLIITVGTTVWRRRRGRRTFPPPLIGLILVIAVVAGSGAAIHAAITPR